VIPRTAQVSEVIIAKSRRQREWRIDDAALIDEATVGRDETESILVEGRVPNNEEADSLAVDDRREPDGVSYFGEGCSTGEEPSAKERIAGWRQQH
jgi:hypothetical protein